MSASLIFQEVDEELRRDRVTSLFRRYGFYLIALAFLFVLSISVYSWWQWRFHVQAGVSGVLFEEALDLAKDGKREAAIGVFQEVIEVGHGGYPDLSRFAQASLEAIWGDRAVAAESYADLSVHAGSEALRTLSLIQLLRLRLDGEYDESLIKDLKRLAQSDTSWRYAARELLGLLSYRRMDIAGAEEIFRRIAGDSDAPQGARQRAEILLSVLMPVRVSLAEGGDNR